MRRSHTPEVTRGHTQSMTSTAQVHRAMSIWDFRSSIRSVPGTVRGDATVGLVSADCPFPFGSLPLSGDVSEYDRLV